MSLVQAFDQATEKKPSKTLFVTSAWLTVRGNTRQAVEAETQRVVTDLLSSGYTVTKAERVAFTDGTPDEGIVGCDIRATRARE